MHAPARSITECPFSREALPAPITRLFVRVRLIHLEDDESDRELVARALRAENIDCTLIEASCREEFERALADPPDLILSDYSLPGFSGDEAQALAQSRYPDVPFVFVSGSIGEERAVEHLKNGATDYVLKHRLDKLAPAVRRALREAEDRRQRGAAEQALRRLNAELEARVEERTRALAAANQELQQARHEADRANRAKSEFLSRMSHDLRTPLNAIMGFAQLLNLDGLNADQVDIVTHILRGGDPLLALINEVLDIARIETGNITLSCEPVGVTDAVERALELIGPLADKRGITVTAEAPDDLYAYADRQRLNEILLNLLSNAVKYNREGGTVRVCAVADGAHVRIDVADTGAGIPADKLGLVFTPFERLGAEHTSIEGTGLGLALARRLAAEMSGTLTVESKVDQGSVFSVALPLTHESDVASPVVADRDDRLPTCKGTVLYIEDNTPNVVLMGRLLKHRPGVTMRHAPDGRIGLQMLRTERPDLVLLDLHLEDMRGEEVLRRIWSDPATRDIPVAVVSADATQGSQRRLRAAGAIAYLTKPFEVPAVLRVIDDVVGAPKGAAS